MNEYKRRCHTVSQSSGNERHGPSHNDPLLAGKVKTVPNINSAWKNPHIDLSSDDMRLGRCNDKRWFSVTGQYVVVQDNVQRRTGWEDKKVSMNKLRSCVGSHSALTVLCDYIIVDTIGE
jgi:hypothetical protein